MHYFLGNIIILGIGLLVVGVILIDEKNYPLAIHMGNGFMIITVIFNLFLYFKRGDKEDNRYGDEIKKDTKFMDAILNRNS